MIAAARLELLETGVEGSMSTAKSLHCHDFTTQSSLHAAPRMHALPQEPTGRTLRITRVVKSSCDGSVGAQEATPPVSRKPSVQDTKELELGGSGRPPRSPHPGPDRV